MVVLLVLFTSWLVFRGIGALGVGALATWQGSAVYALALMFVFTGIAHFNKMKHDLVRMVPAMFPRPMLLDLFHRRSGIHGRGRIAAATLPRTRRAFA